MSLLDAAPDSLLQFCERPRLRGPIGEECAVNIVPTVSTRSPHHDLLVLFTPLEYRSRTDPQAPPHFGGHRGLPLPRDFGISQCHACILPR